MASDLSSGCTDDIDIFEEKEEGELSLEDVSSSEESHPNYRNAYRNAGRCNICMSLEICAPWCEAARAARRNHKKQDAAQGKENRRHAKDPSGVTQKSSVATLQEKNDDLVPISSDSDMEIVGLPGNSKQLHCRAKSAKVRKKKKKKRSHSSVVRVEESLSPTQVETHIVDVQITKKVRNSRSRHREEISPRSHDVRSALDKNHKKSPSRRYRQIRPIKMRSPIRRSRSPISRSISGDKKSARKLRSPRRSPISRSPPRGGGGGPLSRESRDHHSPTTSQNHIDFYASKLLQKVRRLESVGSSTKDLTKSKEHSSLKEKLTNMMKNQAEISQEKMDVRKKSNTVVSNDSDNNNGNNEKPKNTESDDEDDLEVLRRLALETKQKKAEVKLAETKVKSENCQNPESDDNDVEANELRILALRSAIMKKHEKRVTRGVKSKKITKSAPRAESPFNESFLDDFEIFGDEKENVNTEKSDFSPICDYESNNPEDMDIDTDVEREKEKDLMPYSPTDDLTKEIVMEIENNDNNVVANEEKDNFSETRGEKNVTREKNDSPENSDYATGAETPYSPSAPIETPISHKLAAQKSLEENDKISENLILDDAPFSPMRILENSKNVESQIEIENNANITESPYSPTDTPILDPHLFPIFPNLPIVQVENEIGESNEKSEISLEKISELRENVENDDEKNEVFASEQSKNIDLPQNIDICQKINITDGNNEISISEKNVEPLDTIDKLPEVDLDGSPLVPVSKELDNSEIVIPIEISPEISENRDIIEPFYLQCLSDSDKNTNKISSLVNRNLVPSNILKTNKQLQQPLPLKKVDNHTEPSFKSAEMRPVCVDNTQIKLPTMFKPIKLCPISKKPQIMTTMPAAAFNVSFSDDSMMETKKDDEISNVDISKIEMSNEISKIDISNNMAAIEKSPDIDDDDSIGRKKCNSRVKKRRKLRDRRKLSAAESSSNESNRESIDNKGKRKENRLENLSGKKDDRIIGKSIKKSLAKTWENSQDCVSKKDEKMMKETTNLNSEKSKIGKPEVSEVEGKRKKSRRSGKKFQRRKLPSISTEISDKSDDLDTSKSTENPDDESIEKDEEETKKKNDNDEIKNMEISKTDEKTENSRRFSIDEDEEALRAQLLASLPKRTKIVEPEVAKNSENCAIQLDSETNKTTEKIVEKSSNKSANISTDKITPEISPSPSNQSSSNLITTTEKKLATSKMESSKSEINIAENPSLSPRKRPNSTILRGPPKKIVKKASPVITSTKVVNNAKKYQNALIQKKLNLQRAAMNYGTQNGSRNITLNNLKINDSARPSSPKISAASKTQRLVINLGSDSDSDNDYESQQINANKANGQEETRKPLAIPTTDFEKSVVQFLKDQRKKMESVAVPKASTSNNPNITKNSGNNPSPVTGKLSGLFNTPLAVRRHLPVSQQEEYRRLKQQIAEREREKLRKTIESGEKSPCTPPGPLSPANAISALQKTPPIVKSPIMASEIDKKIPSQSSKEKISEKSVLQKKMELVKSTENRSSIINPTKVSKIIVPAIPNKPQTKLPQTSLKINPNKPNPPPPILSSKSIPNIPQKQISTIEKPKIVGNTSTPKSQSSKTSIINRNILPKVTLPDVGKNENIGKFMDVMFDNSMKNSQESSTNFISVPNLASTSNISSGKNLLKATETLTIQIPNDKIQNDRFIGITRSESNSPPNCRNVGMLKILTKEQLNSRFVQIQVKHGSAGRKVTVGGPSIINDNSSNSSSSSPVSRIFNDSRIDDNAKNIFCDSNLILKNNTSVENKRKSSIEETLVVDSDASTFVITRDEENCRTIDSEASTFVVDNKNRNNEKNADSEASTIVVDHENRNNEKNADSEASTLILNHDISEGQESPGLEKTDEPDDGNLMGNIGIKKTEGQVKEVWEKIRTDVKNELESLNALPAEQQKRILIESQENLVAKRNMILDDLTEMSGCLRRWEVEREIQTKLMAEVLRLREQLRTAEKHLHEQRRQMNGMGPKVTRTHEKINHGRRECYKLSRICHGLGTKLIGEEYKVPDTCAQLLNERLKEVAVHTRQLSKKKMPSIDSLNNSRETNSPASSTCSETISENSFVERPSNLPTRLVLLSSCETDNAITEKKLSTNENDLTEDNSNLGEKSNEDFSSCENFISQINDVMIEEGEKDFDESSKKTKLTSVNAENEAQKKDIEGSSLIDINAQMKENKKDDYIFQTDAQTNKTNEFLIESSKSNENSLTRLNNNTNFIELERSEDICMPSTSKSSHTRCELLSSDDDSTVKSKIEPYQSVLRHLKDTRNANPDGILCPYELMGTCSDGDCQFYHLDPSHCQ